MGSNVVQVLPESKSFLYGNGSDSCRLSIHSYEVECYLSVVLLVVGVTLSAFGVVANAHILYIYSIARSLRAGSNQLAFIFGCLDILGCLCSGTTCTLLLITQNRATCVSFTLFHVLLSRVALYLFAYSGWNCYYMQCVRTGPETFFQLPSVKFVLFFMLVFAALEVVFEIYIGCYHFGDAGVLFFKYDFLDKLPQNSWQKILFESSQGLNVVLLFVVSLLFLWFYWRIRKSNEVFQMFVFEDPEFRGASLQVMVEIFKCSSVIGVILLYPQAITWYITYYRTFKTVLGHTLNYHLALAITLVVDFLNVVMFVLTPVIYFKFDQQFRNDLKELYARKLWPTRKIYEALCVDVQRFTHLSTVVDVNDESLAIQ